MSVGMGINNVVKLMGDGLIPFNAETFAKDLWKFASEIVRVSQHMEKGNLAEKKDKPFEPAVSESAKPDDGPDDGYAPY
jgi:hypothetical protein